MPSVEVPQSTPTPATSLARADPLPWDLHPQDASFDSGANGTSGMRESSVALSQSIRSYSQLSTPRSMTPRALTPRSGGAALSAAAAGAIIYKPFLGFRVMVQRDGGSGRSVIAIREVVSSYLNAEGEEEDGPALLAGMSAGDQLLRFAGYAVTDLAAFNAVVARHVKPGAKLPVTLVRDGEQVQTSIRVGLKCSIT